MKMLTLNKTFSDLMRSDFDSVLNDSLFERTLGSRNPLLNISDSEKEITVELVIPGFKKDDLEVSLDDSLLTIKGKKSAESKNESGKYLKKEFTAQEFSRTFRVDSNIDQESITSKLEDGILRIQIPKAKKVESKKTISIC